MSACLTGRVRYPSKKVAKKDARRRGRRDMRVYRCQSCQHFHLTAMSYHDALERGLLKDQDTVGYA